MEEILILCIGDSKLIGDSLGPLIGSFLERNKSDIGNNVKVLGTLEKPIGYNDLIEIAKHINYNKEYYTTVKNGEVRRLLPTDSVFFKTAQK